MLRSIPAKLALIYLLVSGAWIFWSDRVLLVSGVPAERMTQMQTGKGWLFIAVSATLIFALSSHYLRHLHHAQAALRASESQFQSFMNHLPAMAFIKNEQGHYLYVNRFASHAHAQDLKVFAGKTDDEIWPAAELDQIRAEDRQILASDKPLEILRRTNTGGQQYAWLVVKFPLHGHDQPLIGGVALDITTRWQAEEDIRLARDHAEALVRSGQQKLAGVSHQLRHPLLPALLTVSSLLNDPSLSDKVRTEMASVTREIQRESDLIRDLLGPPGRTAPPPAQPAPGPADLARSTPAADDKPNAPGALRILLVEDDAITQNTLSRLLGSMGHQVAAASSMISALELGKRQPFDVLVADIGLPDGTGWDLLRRLGNKRPAYAIALSGYGGEDDLRTSREAGFAEHLTEPIDLNQLRQSLQMRLS